MEFSAVALAHFLAVASPGPDFAIVLKQSLSRGRQPAIWTSVGIGTAILLHVTYSILGLGLLIRGSRLWFEIAKYAGATYLAWIGVQALRSKPRGEATELPADGTNSAAPGSFWLGFFTNVLNPKAALFIISLFVLIVNPKTPRIIQAGYGLWLGLATMAWFSLVAVFFTRAEVRRRFLRYGHWIDRALGIFFLGFAASLALATIG
jgi:RhtB (resistance to homoserine/threonine) family protein